MRFASRVLLLLLALCAGLLAQTYQGRILGTVTDSSGAVVPSAKITITNPDTGLTRTLTTTESGDYVAPALPPGNYQVTVEAPNFKKYEQKGIRLEVAKDVRIDAKLEAGAAAESVTVTSDAPLVETTNNTLGGTFSNKSINELPLNGRDFQNLVVLRPGVQRAPGGGFLSISSNGNRPEDNNFIMDGTDNNDPYYATTVINAEGVQGTPGTVLPIDAIQEFNAQENPPAEYGWKPGAIVNLGLKSGTNNLHGTAYLFERNNAFDARNWTNPKVDPDTGLQSPQRALRQHQFGGSIGGPIIKNRTFFFGAFEGVRALVSNSNSVTTPSTVGSPTITDPTDPNFCATTLVGNCGVSIPNALAELAARGIPLNPLSANLIGQGTFTGNGTFPGLFAPNATGTKSINVGFPNTNRMDDFILKVDHRINDRNQLTGRFFWGSSLQKEQDVTVTRNEWLSQSDLNAQVAGINWVWTPNARWTNEAKIGWNRFWQKITTADDGKSPTDYGINTGVVDPVNFGMPTIRIDGFNNPTLGGNRSWPLYTTPNETLQFADNISWSHGEHTFRFGGEFRHGATDNLRDRSGKGRIRFSGDGAFAGSTALEDFLAGFPSSGDIFVGNSRRHVTIKSFAAFLQDDWKVRPNLTFFLGVRYELNTRIKEEKNRLGNFDPAIGLQQIGINLSEPYNLDGNNFAPRLGFSWDPWNQGKTVLRGGFGITYEQPHLAVFLGQNGADNATTPGLNVIPTGAVGSNINGNIISASSFFDPSGLNWSTSGIVFPSLSAPPDCSASPCDILGVKKNLVTPYVMTWNINLQQQLTNSTSMTVAYVGNRGKKLYSIRNINQYDPVAGARPFDAKFPFLGVINFLENNYASKYNGLQVSVNQRAWKGHTFVLGYTWSHAADQASLNRMLNPQNSLRQDLEWGDSDLDIRHRLTFTHTWDLPGREGFAQLLKGWQINNIVTLQGGTPWNVVDGYINGNDISGTGEFADRWNFFGDPSAFKPLHRGQPIPFFPDGTLNATCLAHADPVQLATFGCYAVGNNVLVPPDAGTFGTMRRNMFRSPGLYNWDFSLVKAFQATERLNIQLRAEFFNVLNRAHLAPANASIFGYIDPSDPSTFGCNCSTPDVGAANPVIGTGGPRNIQLGLKFRF